MRFLGSSGRRALLVLPAFALFAVLFAAPAYAAFPGTNGRIVFQDNDSGSGGAGLFTVAANGTGKTRLTTGLDYWPAWSADGSKIAFTRYTNNHYVVYTMLSNGLLQTALTDGSVDDFQPAWSPDGTRIAFASNRDVRTEYPEQPRQMEIYTMRSDGSDQRRLTVTADPCPLSNPFVRDCPGNFGPAWSPDGTKVAYTHFSSGGDSIRVINADGTGQTEISSFGRDPNWSPDGTQITFTYGDDFTNRAVWVMNADGGGKTRLTEPASADYPAWSPDGRQIVFSSYGMYVLNLDGSGTSQLAQTGTDPDWQPTPPASVSYEKPIGASPVRVPLVPAFDSCASPNSLHGAPMNFPSCGPSIPVSSTVKTGDVSIGFAGVLVCNLNAAPPRCSESAPGFTSAMQPDVRFFANIRDVRCRLTGVPAGCVSGQDYNPNGAPGPYSSSCGRAAGCSSGQLFGPFCAPGTGSDAACAAGTDITLTTGLGRPSSVTVDSPSKFSGHGMRVTDAYNCAGSAPPIDPMTCPGSTSGPAAATLVDFQLPIPIDCLPDTRVPGSTCGVNTSANALVPGMVIAGRRAVVELGQIQVFDSGPDGIRGDGDDERFATQGIYVP
jgi:hypothetical protein